MNLRVNERITHEFDQRRPEFLIGEGGVGFVGSFLDAPSTNESFLVAVLVVAHS